MATVFSESRVKVVRARKHLGELIGLWAAHERDNPPVVDFQSNVSPEGLERDAHLHVRFAPPPDEFSCIVGDIVHNLRAALDLMAVELVGSASNKVYFPFAGSASELPAVAKLRGFEKAGREALNLVLSLRPYKGGNIPLRALHDLDIADKHRKLIPNNLNATTPPIAANMVSGKIILSLDESAPASSVPVFPADWPLAGEPIIPALEGMVALVLDILGQFEALSRSGKGD